MRATTGCITLPFIIVRGATRFVGAASGWAIVGRRAGVSCSLLPAGTLTTEEAGFTSVIIFGRLVCHWRAVVTCWAVSRHLGASTWSADAAIRARIRGRDVPGSLGVADAARWALLAVERIFGAALEGEGAERARLADETVLEHGPVVADGADDGSRCAHLSTLEA